MTRARDEAVREAVEEALEMIELDSDPLALPDDPYGVANTTDFDSR